MYTSDFRLVRIIVNCFSNQLRNYNKHKQCQCVINITCTHYALGKEKQRNGGNGCNVRSTDIVRVILGCFCSQSSMKLLYSVVCTSIVLHDIAISVISANSTIPLFLLALMY